MHDFVYFQYNTCTRPKKRDWHNTSDYYLGVFGVGGPCLVFFRRTTNSSHQNKAIDAKYTDIRFLGSDLSMSSTGGASRRGGASGSGAASGRRGAFSVGPESNV